MYALLAYALFVILYYAMPEIVGTIAGITAIAFVLVYAYIYSKKSSDIRERGYTPTAVAPVVPVAYSSDHEADTRP